MLCVRCKKNLAVVYVSKFDQDGKQQNEGYCLSCAKELNLGPVNEMIEKMGIDVEELDSLNSEMNSMVEQMGDMDPEMMEEMAQQLMGGEDFDEDDEEEQGRTMKTPFSMFSQFMGGKNKTEKDGEKSAKKEKKNKDRKFLEMYGTNLTTKARNGEVDRVIGRDAEITRVMQILNRRTKNNPCLIGEPGVGKTAIAEGLAVKIVNGEVPAKLLKYEIYLIDMSAMVAGTQFRGQFEQRLKNLISEVKKLGNIILVIDEVHTLTKAGDADGAMNAGNILKPALSKGEIQIIGATTLEEYRKHIEKDSALERRFQTVMVEEPSVEETIEILKGIKEYYEKYHNVKITDDIIRTAAVLSERYITDRFLPDKAIDVIDEAASKVNLDNTALAEIEKLNIELEKVKREQAELEGQEESEGYFEKTAELKSMVCKIENEIEALSKGANDIYLTPEDLANVIEGWTKIPVKNITEFESRRLINLEERLHTRLIGQDEAVSSVARAIRRKRAGISIKKRPVSFIFVGPTGVGKTELVKQIAREVFDSEENLIRLDMSEYMEKHSVAKLIGAPPGYVGYDDAGQLTEKVRRKPYSVILLDEIEKAHADIFNILLQILDDGRITDSRGKVVSFENTIIVMTSNAGSEIGNSVAGFGYTDNSANDIKVDRALKQLFRPEFLNRVDEIIKFRELNKDELKKIAALMLSDLKAGLDEKAVTMEVEDSAIELILEKAYHVAYGARPMRRYIERNIEDKFATLIIEGELNAGDKMRVFAENGEIVIKKI